MKHEKYLGPDSYIELLPFIAINVIYYLLWKQKLSRYFAS